MMWLLFVLAEKTMVEFHCILNSFLLVKVVHIELDRTRILPVWWTTKSSNVWSILAILQNREEPRSGLRKSFRLLTRLRCSNLMGLGGCPMFFRWSSILYFFSFFYGNFKLFLKKRKINAFIPKSNFYSHSPIHMSWLTARHWVLNCQFYQKQELKMKNSDLEAQNSSNMMSIILKRVVQTRRIKWLQIVEFLFS